MVLKGELSWLTRHFKGYPVPLVVYSASLPWDGYYEWNMDQILIIDGQEYFNEFGLIVVNSLCASTLAHEYRHHLQIWRRGPWAVPANMENDWTALCAYYRSCEQEHDAMMFERSMDECRKESDYWFSLLDIPKSRSRALLLP